MVYVTLPMVVQHLQRIKKWSSHILVCNTVLHGIDISIGIALFI